MHKPNILLVILDATRAGTATLRFMDVPSAINPRTVHLKSLTAPGALTVLEQNYEYDLISPEKLLEKYVGRPVEIVEQAEDLTTRTVPATLLSVNGGPVYRIGDRIVLNQAGKVSLPELPADPAVVERIAKRVMLTSRTGSRPRKCLPPIGGSAGDVSIDRDAASGASHR